MKYILGAYSQIPYGSSDNEYKNLLERQLRPLLTLLYQNGTYKILLRFGINVYEWLECNHPEINMLIFDLCKKDQIELLSSPDYDAILPLIPNHERTKFIEKTTTYIRKKFSKKPKGFFNSYQIFNPSVISSVGLSSIEYIVTSTYEQTQSKELFNKPFYMEELGRGMNFFTINEKFSREVADFSKQKISSDKFISNMTKLLDENSSSPELIMINLDQILFSQDSFKLFVRLFERINNNLILPSEFLKEKEISARFYLPAGIYGHDISLSGYYSINQMILNNKKFYKNYALNNYYRDITHDFKKNSDLKKNIDFLLMKSSAGSVYINNLYTRSDTQNFSDRYLCEIESKLYGDNYSDLPLQADIVGDKFPQDIFPLKNQLVYINRRGAVIDRLSSFDFMSDLTFFDSNGSFSDSIKSSSSQKLPNLNNKIFELKSIDKKRQDVVYYLNNVEVNMSHIDIYKRYRFNKNLISLDIDFENISDSPIKDIVYENTIKLCLSESTTANISDNFITVNNPNSYMEILLTLNENADISCKSVYGNDNVYKYHIIKISRLLNINGKQIDHLCINLKIDKTKEKTYDIGKQKQTRTAQS